MTISASVTQALSRLEPEDGVSHSELMHRTPQTAELAQTLKESPVKHSSILKSLLLMKTSAKHPVMALLLGFATLSMAVGGMSSTARAEDGTPTPVQGSWLTTITRTNQVGVSFTALISFAAGGKRRVQMIGLMVGFQLWLVVGGALAKIATARKRISLPSIPAATRLSYSESISFTPSKTRINSKELAKLTSVHCKAKAKTA
jgi:hypothetical protein